MNIKLKGPFAALAVFASWVTILLGALIFAFPFWLIWTYYGLGHKFFAFLAPVYLEPNFWECCGLYFVAMTLRNLLYPGSKS